jgi:hypothetical protein
MRSDILAIKIMCDHLAILLWCTCDDDRAATPKTRGRAGKPTLLFAHISHPQPQPVTTFSNRTCVYKHELMSGNAFENILAKKPTGIRS